MAQVNTRNHKKLLQQATNILEDINSFLKKSKNEDDVSSAIEHINNALKCLGQRSVKAMQPGELLQRNKE